jgi:hypothetical protein
MVTFVLTKSVNQIMNTVKLVPFAKSLRKPDLQNMLTQLQEQSLLSSKCYSLVVDEDDICFAFEDTPFASVLVKPSEQ